MTLVHRDFRSEANKHLFQHVRVIIQRPERVLSVADARSLLHEACTTIMHETRRPYVRCFTLALSGLGTGRPLEEAVIKLSNTLNSLPRLSNLTLEGELDALDALASLSPKLLIPTLSSFSSDIYGFSLAFSDIVDHHHDLTSLAIPPGITDYPLSLPLPHLQCIKLASEDQAAFMRGSPVTEIHVAHDPYIPMASYDDFASNIAQSTKDILRFTIHSDRRGFSKHQRVINRIYPEFLHAVFPKMPHLQFFSIEDEPNEYTSGGTLDAVSSLRELEEFEWRGDVTPAIRQKFFDTCSVPCDALRRVKFEGWPPRVSHEERRLWIYERSGHSEPWIGVFEGGLWSEQVCHVFLH